MSYFLFGFSSNMQVLQAPSGSKIGDQSIPKPADWVIFLDKYDIDFEYASSLSGEHFWYARLWRGEPAIYQEVDSSSGDEMYFQFTIGKDTDLLSQFNEPETWGAWSATDGASLVLPVILEGRIQVSLKAWIDPQNLERDLELVLGETSAHIELSPEPTIYCFSTDLPSPTREIVLRGIRPYRPNPWDRPIAVAVSDLWIREADGNLADECVN
jgi:hypothetical protein